MPVTVFYAFGVYAIGCVSAFGLGWLVRRERDLYRRSRRPEVLDFTRERVGL